MFKKGHSVEPRRPIFTAPPVAASRRWKYLLAALLTGAGTLGVALTWWLMRTKPRRNHRKRSILVEPPASATMESEDSRLNSHSNLHRLHVSHSAPSLLTQPHNGLWDVVIIGGGPAGATAAYYLAKADVNVLVIEKDVFPRDKICGDQIQPHAQHILTDMGVMQTLLDEDVVKWTTTRGIVSPAGISFIGEMKERETLLTVQRIVLDKKIMEAATKAGAALRENLTVKSAHLSRARSRHERRRSTQSHFKSHRKQDSSEISTSEDDDEVEIEGDYWSLVVSPTGFATASSSASSAPTASSSPAPSSTTYSMPRSGRSSSFNGASNLNSEMESHNLQNLQNASSSHPHTHQNHGTGAASNHHDFGRTATDSVILARLIICADGANAHVARNLTGLSPDESPSLHLGPPNAVGCRAFAKHRTHHCRADEVSFYTREMLPGHFRISGELEDFLNLSCFALPSDDYNTTQLPLQAIHQFTNALSEPWINATLGPDRELTPVRTAPMRVGGVHRTFFPHGVIVGDAAGHTDPLSGDGLQYGLRAAKMAAETLTRALTERNFSSSFMQRYERAWKSAFGWDFFWGRQIVYLMARFPILVDAVTLVIQRHGMKAISFWALAKAGSKSKWELILWFLRPDVAWLMAFYSFNLWLRKRGFF